MLDEAVRRDCGLRLREVGCWPLRDHAVLGTLLVARGFEYGWQPHRITLELRRAPERPLA